MTSAAKYVTTGDFNGDGQVDIVVSMASAGAVGIFLNQGGGALAPLISHPVAAPAAIGARDLNGDGLDDIVVGSTSSSVTYVLLNQGTVTFTAAASIPQGAGRSMAFGDVNGDGTFTLLQVRPTGVGPGPIVIGDMNRDGAIDVIASNSVAIPSLLPNRTISVFLSDGTGTLQPRRDFNGLGATMTSGDFNGDGATDIAITSDTSSLQLLFSRCIP